MSQTPVPRVIVATLILLASFLLNAGCASSAPISDTPGKKAAPVTTDRSQSK